MATRYFVLFDYECIPCGPASQKLAAWHTGLESVFTYNVEPWVSYGALVDDITKRAAEDSIGSFFWLAAVPLCVATDGSAVIVVYDPWSHICATGPSVALEILGATMNPKSRVDPPQKGMRGVIQLAGPNERGLSALDTMASDFECNFHWWRVVEGGPGQLCGCSRCRRLENVAPDEPLEGEGLDRHT